MRSFRVTAAGIMVCVICSAGLAQVGAGDYRRADTLGAHFEELVYNGVEKAEWVGSSHTFWFSTRDAELGKQFMLHDAESGIQKPAFDHGRLSRLLSETWNDTLTHKPLPFNSITLDEEMDTLRFSYGGYSYICDLNTWTVTRKEQGKDRRGRRGSDEEKEHIISPDSTFQAFIRNSDL